MARAVSEILLSERIWDEKRAVALGPSFLAVKRIAVGGYLASLDWYELFSEVCALGFPLLDDRGPTARNGAVGRL